MDCGAISGQRDGIGWISGWGGYKATYGANKPNSFANVFVLQLLHMLFSYFLWNSSIFNINGQHSDLIG